MAFAPNEKNGGLVFFICIDALEYYLLDLTVWWVRTSNVSLMSKEIILTPTSRVTFVKEAGQVIII